MQNKTSHKRQDLSTTTANRRSVFGLLPFGLQEDLAEEVVVITKKGGSMDSSEVDIPTRHRTSLTPEPFRGDSEGGPSARVSAVARAVRDKMQLPRLARALRKSKSSGLGDQELTIIRPSNDSSGDEVCMEFNYDDDDDESFEDDRNSRRKSKGGKANRKRSRGTAIPEQGNYAVLDDGAGNKLHGGSASILSCVINLTNTVAGAGMLGLPGAYAGSGFVVGSMILIAASLFSANGLRLLAISAETAGIRRDRPSSFYTVASAALPEFTIFIDLAVALKCFGVATGYFITVGDCMVDSFQFLLRNFNMEGHPMEEFLTNRHFWVLSGLFFVLPISFYKTLDALKFTSTLSLMLIYALAAGIVLYAEGVFDPCEGVEGSLFSSPPLEGDSVHLDAFSSSEYNGIEGDEEGIEYIENAANASVADGGRDDMVSSFVDGDTVCQGETELVTSFTSTLKNLAIFVFSFTCHQNVFSVVNEIKDRSRARVDCVISAAIGTALLLYLVVAIEGYRTYGNQVLGDILLNYPQTALVTTMRIFIAAMVILSYPLQLDPSRRCLTSLIHSVNALVDKWKTRGNEGTVAQREALEFPSDDDAGPDGGGKNGVTLSSGASPSDATTDVDDNSSLETVENGGEVEVTPIPRSDAAAAVQGDEGFDDEAMLAQVGEEFLFKGITCTFLVFSFIIAMLVSDLGVILAVVGATGSTMVSYILPGAIFVKLHPDFTSLKCVAYIQLVTGCLIVPTALYFVIFYGAAA